MVLHLSVGVAVTAWYFAAKEKPAGVDTSLYVVRQEVITFADGEYERGEHFAEKVVDSNERLIISMIIGFVFITALFHAFYAFSGKYYTSMINRGNNWVRWVEYAITATLMLVILALLTGVKEMHTIVMFIVGAIAIMLLGDAIEKALIASGKMSGMSATLSAWIILVGIFVVLIRTYILAAEDSDSIPWFVPYILFITLAFYASFGGVQLAHQIGLYKKGGYKSVEKTYITLSFISKAALALLVTGGFMSQGTDEKQGHDDSDGETGPPKKSAGGLREFLKKCIKDVKDRRAVKSTR
jgi:hypothetical protein